MGLKLDLAVSGSTVMVTDEGDLVVIVFASSRSSNDQPHKPYSLAIKPTEAMRLLAQLEQARADHGWSVVAPDPVVYVPPKKDRN